jgi:3-phosphoshikimate 1-carboxyvinyltransferase
MMNLTNHSTLPGRQPAEGELTLTVYPGMALKGEIGTAGPSEMVELSGTASQTASAGLPGDKSISHRAALLAALAEGESRIANFQVSGVTRPMLAALTDLQVDWDLQGSQLHINSPGFYHLRSPGRPLFCGNSATTLRLMAGALAGGGLAAELDGSPGLRRRPMQRIVEPLRALGVPIEATNDCAPLHLQRGALPLRGGAFHLPVASAQVKSCLLLAALSASGPVTVIEPGPSRDHTERMLRGLGVAVTAVTLVTEVSGITADANGEDYSSQSRQSTQVQTTLIPTFPSSLPPLNVVIPGDFSAAAFLIVAACITPGSQVCIRGVGLNPTRTGLLDALVQMGADIRTSNLSEIGGEPVGDVEVSYHPLRGGIVAGDLVVRMIDEFPAFAVAALSAQGVTSVLQAEELRNKESDRISDLCHELRHLGADITEFSDGFSIQGGRPLLGCQVDPHGDHRLAMALAVAGLAAQSPVSIRQAGIFHESFPGFVAILQSLGADLVLE